MTQAMRRVMDFVEAAEAASTLEELDGCLRQTFASFGVPNYTLAAMLDSPNGGARQFTPLTHGVTADWSQHYRDAGCFNFDAAVHRALQSDKPFAWSEIEAQRLPKASARLFGEIREAMPIDGGLVVPVHDEKGFAGVASLMCEDADPHPEFIYALKLVSLFGIERAKHLLGVTSPVAACPLSQRQREILTYAALGKSEADTGDILGIAATTVREHFIKIRALMNVRTKVQAVAIAVQRGWIAI